MKTPRKIKFLQNMYLVKLCENKQHVHKKSCIRTCCATGHHCQLDHIYNYHHQGAYASVDLFVCLQNNPKSYWRGRSQAKNN